MSDIGAVNVDTASAAVESNPSPTTSDAPVTTGSATADGSVAQNPGGTANAIPHWRVEQMRAADRKAIAELREKMNSYESVLSKVNEGIHGMAKGFGFAKDPEPTFVDANRYQQDLTALREQMSNQMREEMLYQRVSSDWNSVSQKYADWAAIPGFKQAFLDAWSKDPNKGHAHADSIVQAYEKMFAARQNKVAEEKAAVASTKVVKSGGGTGNADKSEKKTSLADRIAATLNSR